MKIKNKGKLKISDTSGITLIALIITIIVLLILAGITLNMLLGDNGIIKRAREAGEEYTNKAIEENELLSEAEQIMQNYISKINKSENSGGPKPGDMVEVPDGKNWDTDKVNPTIVDEEENVIPIPKELEYKEGTKDTGVVVIDSDTSNEFVWVPTDEITYDRYDFTITGSRKKGECIEPDYNTDYTDSVEKYGGFYIARFEAGIENPRTESGAATESPRFQKNNYPYIFITWQQAKDLSVGLYNSSTNIKSDLINSYALDTTLSWIESTNPDKNVDTDSTNWGNYLEKVYTITGIYSTNEGVTYTNGTYTKQNESRVLLGTGVLEDAKANNIYDLAGNLWEWTTEEFSGDPIHRGGGYRWEGNSPPAGFRNSYDPINIYRDRGFRALLYIGL